MANNKIGFVYYATDTNRYQDIKIKQLKKEFKGDGVAVWDYVLNEIFRVKGCYIEWDKNVLFDVADYWGLKESIVTEIINYCCYVGLFNKALFASGSILTSAAIQARYLDWSIKARRVNYEIPASINLLKGQNAVTITQNANILPQNSGNTDQNHGSLPRSKVKELKEKERKSAGAQGFAPPVFDAVFYFFKDKINETAWSEEKCKAEAKNFLDFYGRTSWQTRNGPVTIWENAASGWITSDEKFKKGDGAAKTNGKGHPDEWSKTWESSLDASGCTEYWRHLRSLGLAPKKVNGNTVGWEKMQDHGNI